MPGARPHRGKKRGRRDVGDFQGLDEIRARRYDEMKMTLSLFIAMIGFTMTAAAADAPQQVTFAKNVAPIFQAHCQSCHHVGTVAPMSLVTYQEARPWAAAIKQRVSAREMPPWFIDRNVGVQHFQNDESLTDEEIATIVKWVDNGAPQGNPADMPPARQFADDQAWQMGKPDVIISLDR